jgi:hypothetical protein
LECKLALQWLATRLLTVFGGNDRRFKALQNGFRLP